MNEEIGRRIQIKKNNNLPLDQTNIDTCSDVTLFCTERKIKVRHHEELISELDLKRRKDDKSLMDDGSDEDDDQRGIDIDSDNEFSVAVLNDMRLPIAYAKDLTALIGFLDKLPNKKLNEIIFFYLLYRERCQLMAQLNQMNKKAETNLTPIMEENDDDNEDNYYRMNDNGRKNNCDGNCSNNNIELNINKNFIYHHHDIVTSESINDIPPSSPPPPSDVHYEEIKSNKFFFSSSTSSSSSSTAISSKNITTTIPTTIITNSSIPLLSSTCTSETFLSTMNTLKEKNDRNINNLMSIVRPIFHELLLNKHPLISNENHEYERINDINDDKLLFSENLVESKELSFNNNVKILSSDDLNRIETFLRKPSVYDVIPQTLYKRRSRSTDDLLAASSCGSPNFSSTPFHNQQNGTKTITTFTTISKTVDELTEQMTYLQSEEDDDDDDDEDDEDEDDDDDDEGPKHILTFDLTHRKYSSIPDLFFKNDWSNASTTSLSSFSNLSDNSTRTPYDYHSISCSIPTSITPSSSTTHITSSPITSQCSIGNLHKRKKQIHIDNDKDMTFVYQVNRMRKDECTTKKVKLISNEILNSLDNSIDNSFDDYIDIKSNNEKNSNNNHSNEKKFYYYNDRINNFNDQQINEYVTKSNSIRKKGLTTTMLSNEMSKEMISQKFPHVNSWQQTMRDNSHIDKLTSTYDEIIGTSTYLSGKLIHNQFNSFRKSSRCRRRKLKRIRHHSLTMFHSNGSHHSLNCSQCNHSRSTSYTTDRRSADSDSDSTSISVMKLRNMIGINTAILEDEPFFTSSKVSHEAESQNGQCYGQNELKIRSTIPNSLIEDNSPKPLRENYSMIDSLTNTTSSTLIRKRYKENNSKKLIYRTSDYTYEIDYLDEVLKKIKYDANVIKRLEKFHFNLHTLLESNTLNSSIKSDCNTLKQITTLLFGEYQSLEESYGKYSTGEKDVLKTQENIWLLLMEELSRTYLNPIDVYEAKRRTNQLIPEFYRIWSKVVRSSNGKDSPANSMISKAISITILNKHKSQKNHNTYTNNIENTYRFYLQKEENKKKNSLKTSHTVSNHENEESVDETDQDNWLLHKRSDSYDKQNSNDYSYLTQYNQMKNNNTFSNSPTNSTSNSTTTENEMNTRESVNKVKSLPHCMINGNDEHDTNDNMTQAPVPAGSSTIENMKRNYELEEDLLDPITLNENNMSSFTENNYKNIERSSQISLNKFPIPRNIFSLNRPLYPTSYLRKPNNRDGTLSGDENESIISSVSQQLPPNMINSLIDNSHFHRRREQMENSTRIQPDPTKNDPRFIRRPTDIVVRHGELAKFICKVEGTQPTEVFWYKSNGEELVNNEKYELYKQPDGHHVLKMYNCEKDIDNGLILCVAANEVSHNVDSIKLQVRNQTKSIVAPKFLESMKDIEVYESYSASFRIKIDYGYPKCRVMFFRNEHALRHGYDKTNIDYLGDGIYELTIDCCENNDNAKYTCKLINTSGIQETSAELYVLEYERITKTDTMQSNENQFKWNYENFKYNEETMKTISTNSVASDSTQQSTDKASEVNTLQIDNCGYAIQINEMSKTYDSQIGRNQSSTLVMGERSVDYQTKSIINKCEDEDVNGTSLSELTLSTDPQTTKLKEIITNNQLIDETTNNQNNEIPDEISSENETENEENDDDNDDEEEEEIEEIHHSRNDVKLSESEENSEKISLIKDITIKETNSDVMSKKTNHNNEIDNRLIHSKIMEENDELSSNDEPIVTIKRYEIPSELKNFPAVSELKKIFEKQPKSSKQINTALFSQQRRQFRSMDGLNDNSFTDELQSIKNVRNFFEKKTGSFSNLKSEPSIVVSATKSVDPNQFIETNKTTVNDVMERRTSISPTYSISTSTSSTQSSRTDDSSGLNKSKGLNENFYDSGAERDMSPTAKPSTNRIEDNSTTEYSNLPSVNKLKMLFDNQKDKSFVKKASLTCRQPENHQKGIHISLLMNDPKTFPNLLHNDHTNITHLNNKEKNIDNISNYITSTKNHHHRKLTTTKLSCSMDFVNDPSNNDNKDTNNENGNRNNETNNREERCHFKTSISFPLTTSKRIPIHNRCHSVNDQIEETNNLVKIDKLTESNKANDEKQWNTISSKRPPINNEKKDHGIKSNILRYVPNTTTNQKLTLESKNSNCYYEVISSNEEILKFLKSKFQPTNSNRKTNEEINRYQIYKNKLQYNEILENGINQNLRIIDEFPLKMDEINQLIIALRH
ncbi:hypothetical protein SNEBB_003373 [Seison nebaliae]|nr:hypothetical protein SNEBB_003373 [Seison nebaliae]